ncbi:MAG: antA/AntB antirepressor family protein [Rikenellaceae bacterium]
MNELMNKTNLTPIEIALGVDEKGRTTARKLYEFLELAKGQFSRWAKSNITDNQFAEEGVDYEGFDIDVEGNIVKDYNLTAAFAKKLSITAKNQKGEQARDYFIKVEEGAVKLTSKIQELSPQLQLLINIELQQKQLQQAIDTNKQEIQNMRDVITLSPASWRKDTSSLINKIAAELGGYEHIKNVREESYKLLNERFGVDVKTRLTNKRRRMADEGVCKSTRDKLTILDVIADDKKLIEGYIAIVKEMAIKNKVA